MLKLFHIQVVLEVILEELISKQLPEKYATQNMLNK